MTDSKWAPIESAPKDGTLRIPLTLGQYAIIDARDVSLVDRFSWHATQRRDGKGYYAKNAGGTRLHRLLLGVWDSRIVDHVNGDGLDNRRSNLRIGTQSQNCVNRRTTPGTLLRGVSRQKGLYRATIKIKGRVESLGYFRTESAAHAAYLAKAKEIWGDWHPQALPISSEKSA